MKVLGASDDDFRAKVSYSLPEGHAENWILLHAGYPLTHLSREVL